MKVHGTILALLHFQITYALICSQRSQVHTPVITNTWLHVEGCSTSRQILNQFLHRWKCTVDNSYFLNSYKGEKQDTCAKNPLWKVHKNTTYLAQCREKNDKVIALCDNNNILSYFWKNTIFDKSDIMHWEWMSSLRGKLGRNPNFLLINGGIHEFDKDFVDAGRFKYTATQNISIPLLWRVIKRTKEMIIHLQETYNKRGTCIIWKTSNEFCKDERKSALSFINNVTLQHFSQHFNVINVFSETGAISRCDNPTKDRWHHPEYFDGIFSLIENCSVAVGIDLNPGPLNKYVLRGDFHDIQFSDISFDYVYTNVVDHVLNLGNQENQGCTIIIALKKLLHE